MNLGRAKTILIIAFAGLNLFLGYQLFWPDFGKLTNVAVTAEELRQTESVLNENNYYLETTIDRAVKTSDFLTVSPARDIRKEILSKLIEEGAQIEGSESTTLYRTEEKVAVVHTSGLLQLLYNPGIYLVEDAARLDENELRDLVEQFLSTKIKMPEGIQFDYLERNTSESVILHYYHVLDGVPIFASQLRVIAGLDYVKALEIYWLKPVERAPVREMQVISATEALTNLVEELGPSTEPRQIIQIELGYYSGEYEAEIWEIPPVWRIALDGREYYYINAFTGNMEQNAMVPVKLSY